MTTLTLKTLATLTATNMAYTQSNSIMATLSFFVVIGVLNLKGAK